MSELTVTSAMAPRASATKMATRSMAESEEGRRPELAALPAKFPSKKLVGDGSRCF